MLRCSIVFSLLIILLQFGLQIAKSQTIPVIGSAETLEVATWNIEWFGSDSNGPTDDAQQLANVQAVIAQAGIDLWGVQEIADPNDFDALLTGLGDGYAGVLATESGQQRIGFIYKTDVFSNVVVRHILSTFSFEFAGRVPLQLEGDITLGNETRRLSFIVLHMKAFSDQSSYERRVDASMRLKSNIDILRPNDPIIVLGDFNDTLIGSIRTGQPSPYDNFLQDPAYFFPSLALENNGDNTFCRNRGCTDGSTIDHILVTDELIPIYEADSAARFEALLSELGNYVFSTSDHLPVFARFDFSIISATEEVAVPEALLVAPAYPNPFQDHTTLTYSLPQATPVRAEVFDVLGRRVAVLADGLQAAGTHRLLLASHSLPPGLLLVRLTTPTAIHTQHVVSLR